VPRKKPTPSSTPLDGVPPRRSAILHAAFAVLMEHGYAGASTLEIATRAKVSKRELYAEFGNKAGILNALIAATSARMQVPLHAAEITDRTALATALRRYGITALGELTVPAVIAINRLAVAEAGQSSDMGQVLEAAGREPNRRAMIDLFTRAQARGLVGGGDPDVMAGQFFSLLTGDLPLRLMLGVTRAPTAAEIERRAEAATDAVLQLNTP
jgi:AcrR family transcriptional regulator